MKNWAEFYKDRVNNIGYTRYFEQKYAPFLETIYEEAKLTTKIAEIGCGTGLVSQLLLPKLSKSQFLLVDKCPMMLEYASKRPLGASPRVLLVQDNLYSKNLIASLRGCKVVFSHGVLEHFSPENIQKVVQKLPGTQIHYVPTNKYKTKSFGDELLMSESEWNDLVKPRKSFTFNKGKDLCLII
jgi:SAM-dependent methyltransferase